MSKTSILSALSKPASQSASAVYAAADACHDVASEILSKTTLDEIELVLFHTSTSFDLDEVAHNMTSLFVNVPTVGCTSAGEFNKNGYCTESLVVVAFLKHDFSIATALVSNVDKINFDEAHDIASGLRHTLQARDKRYDTNQHFVISVLDGLTRHEEHF